MNSTNVGQNVGLNVDVNINAIERKVIESLLNDPTLTAEKILLLLVKQNLLLRDI